MLSLACCVNMHHVPSRRRLDVGQRKCPCPQLHSTTTRLWIDSSHPTALEDVDLLHVAARRACSVSLSLSLVLTACLLSLPF